MPSTDVRVGRGAGRRIGPRIGPRIARRVAGRIAPRHRLRLGVGRLRDGWWSIGQCALAGTLAWEFGDRVLHHSTPFFASVAAIVCLSISTANRLRRVGEIALGVTIGVGLGDVLVRQIGHGSWQLGLVVVVAMSLALLLDGGTLIVTQAALQSVFVVALPAPSGGYLTRWEDALVGGLVALLVAFVLPADPLPALRRVSNATVHAVAGALRECAAAARAVDAEQGAQALELLRGTHPQLERWRDQVRASEEVSRLSPLRRRAEVEIAAHRRGLGPLDRAVRNLRVAARRVLAVVDDEQHGGPAGALSAGVLDQIDALAGVFHTVPGALRDPYGEGARRLDHAVRAVAERLDPAALDARSMSATVVVAQLRSAVVDLLQMTGTSPADARAQLPR